MKQLKIVARKDCVIYKKDVERHYVSSGTLGVVFLLNESVRHPSYRSISVAVQFDFFASLFCAPFPRHFSLAICTDFSFRHRQGAAFTHIYQLEDRMIFSSIIVL